MRIAVPGLVGGRRLGLVLLTLGLLAPFALRPTAVHAAGCGAWMDTTLTAEQRATALLAAMTNADKAKLTQFQDVIWAHGGAAGFIAGNATLCIPDLVLNDAGQGVGDLMQQTTAFPAPISTAASWDPAAQQIFGAQLGNQAWNRGVNVQLAPAMETNRVPMNGRNWEYYSEDPYLSGQTAVAVTQGLQSQNVIATLKHYVANSQENNRMTVSSDIDERTLHELYLPQYEAAIKPVGPHPGAGSVMCSYNRINSVYACENYDVLTTDLKGQMAFPGFVMSDWGATHSTVASANNGMDMEMNLFSPTYFGSTLVTAVQNNQVSQARLDDMAKRILREMFAVGLFDHPPTAEPQAQASVVDTPAANTLAGQIAAQGTVLLKNQANVLPLQAPLKKIAVIGAPAGQAGALLTYNGGGSGHIPEIGSKNNVVSPLTGVQTLGTTKGDVITYADGSGPQFADAVAAATAADVAVVFAYDSKSEGVDQANLSLPPNGTVCTLFGCVQGSGYNQDALIAAVASANPNTVVVLETGGPVKMPWLSQVKGVLEAWYPGQDEGDAIASVLFGDVNPSGKLPQTFPASEADLPTNTPAQYPGITVAGDSVGPHSTYSEGLDVGYRWFDDHGITPLFPFGHGLSYTTFGYSNLSVTPAPSPAGQATVAFDVTNTGSVAGAEVPQLYVGAPANNYVGEPLKQLRGYQKVTLQPGASTHVVLSVEARAVSYWDSTTHSWQPETGCHPVVVGSSSRDLRLQGPGLTESLTVGACTLATLSAQVPESFSDLALVSGGTVAALAVLVFRSRRRRALRTGGSTQ